MTGKMKCYSAAERRVKRIKTGSSCSSSNSVNGPIVFKQVINQEEETSSSSCTSTCSSKVQECARILRDTNGMPYPTYKKALEEFRDFHTTVFFIEMSWEQRLEWLEEMTPPEMKKAFLQWRKTFLSSSTMKSIS